MSHDPIRPPACRRSGFWADAGLAILSAALSVLHLCQAVIFSGFSRLPGDLGDGRLNNLILEHVFRSWQGRGSLWSPGQFYPVPGTLVYSDNHLGTAFIYAGFRLMGCRIETAFQCWLIVIGILNALSLYALLRELGLERWLRIPCVFLGTSSCALVAQFYHPQILPFFPLVLALLFLARAWRLRDPRYLIPAILLYTYQHYCYLYDGYFLTWILLLLLPAWMVAGAPWRFRRPAMSHRLFRSLGLIAAAGLVSGLALLWIYRPYSTFSRENGTRSVQEVVMNTPRWSSWFSTSHFSLLYAGQDFLPSSDEVNPIENHLFPGWMIWVLGSASAFWLWSNRERRRTDPSWRILACILFVWVAILAVFTAWSASGRSPYVFLCEQIPAMRAFRAVSRIAYPLAVLQSVLAGLFLQSLLRSSTRWIRVAAIAAACLLPLDTFSFGEDSCSKDLARGRALAVLQEWRKIGGGKPLLFAPGFTNQDAYAVHLDAWSAALRNDGCTVNGYSGNIPNIPGFGSFLLIPTLDNGRCLLANLGIPEASVAIVTGWGAPFMQKAGIAVADVSPSIAPRTPIRSLFCRPGARLRVPVSLHYHGTGPIAMDSCRIFATYRVFGDAGNLVENPPSLRTRVPALKPGQSIQLFITVVAPSTRGRYRVHLSMVHEGVAWWEDLGWGGDVISLVVKD